MFAFDFLDVFIPFPGVLVFLLPLAAVDIAVVKNWSPLFLFAVSYPDLVDLTHA
jgi:hypothetical protein